MVDMLYRWFCVGFQKSFSMKERFSEIEFCNIPFCPFSEKNSPEKDPKRKNIFQKELYLGYSVYKGEKSISYSFLDMSLISR